MSFANPWVLWLLIPLAALLALAGALKYYLRPAVKYPVPLGVKTAFNPWAFLANWAGFGLISAALVLCLFALARPRQAGQAVLPPAAGVDIMMVLDISRSMEAVDFAPNRLAAAKEEAQNFVARRVADRLGMIVFDDIPLLQCPLTLDYFAVEDYIKMLHIGMTGGSGATAIGDALALAANHLKTSVASSKVIVLLTDGESNAGALDPLASAKAAASYGVKIYTIAMSGDPEAVQMPAQDIFGNTKYVPAAPISDEGAALLKQIAAMTGAQAYRAKNNLELQAIYAQIDALEKTDFEASAILNYTDKYQGLLAAAIMLLLLAFAVDKFIFIKIP